MPSLYQEYLFELYYLQGMSEKMSKQVEAQISDLNSRLDESSRNIQELNASKSRLQSETSELTRQLEEAESKANQLARDRSNLTALLDEAKRTLDEETRVCYCFPVNYSFR